MADFVEHRWFSGVCVCVSVCTCGFDGIFWFRMNTNGSNFMNWWHQICQNEKNNVKWASEMSFKSVSRLNADICTDLHLYRGLTNHNGNITWAKEPNSNVIASQVRPLLRQIWRLFSVCSLFVTLRLRIHSSKLRSFFLRLNVSEM